MRKLGTQIVKRRKLTVALALLAPAFISGGMALRDYFEFSPTVGWISGFVLLLLSLNFAVKDK